MIAISGMPISKFFTHGWNGHFLH